VFFFVVVRRETDWEKGYSDERLSREYERVREAEKKEAMVSVKKKK
jgi:hypothetical protein